MMFAIISAGYFYAAFQNKYKTIAYSNRYQDLFLAWIFGIFFGPFILFIMYIDTSLEYGWMNPFKVNKHYER